MEREREREIEYHSILCKIFPLDKNPFHEKVEIDRYKLLQGKSIMSP